MPKTPIPATANLHIYSWYQRDEHRTPFDFYQPRLMASWRILIVSCKSLPKICEKSQGWPTSWHGCMYKLTLFFGDLSLTRCEKVAFLKHRRHEVKMVHQQMWCLKSLDRLVNGYSELQRPVCAGWSPGEGKRNLTEKCRKLNSGSRFRNYSNLLQMFAMAEVE